MKSHKPQSAPKARMPKARVMHTELPRLFTCIPQVFHQRPMPKDSHQRGFPVAVLPFPSTKAAKAFVRVSNMTQEERVEFVGAQLFHPLADYDRAKYPDEIRKEQARAVLSALSFPQAGGGK